MAILQITEADINLHDGRTLHIYDTGPGSVNDQLAVVWHHGTPNIGAPPVPLFDVSDRLGIRWVSYDRPGYGGSTPLPDRGIANASMCAASIADALGIDRFAVMGHSGGGTHALACGALLPDRVLAVVSISGLAPYGADGLAWYDGMYPGGAASLHAAREGRAAKARYEAEATYDPEMFTLPDRVALAGPWSWLNGVVELAMANGPGGMIDDDLAYVAPWGFDPASVVAPTLIVHGEVDRIVPSAHSAWLASRIPTAELWLRPGAGHISVLDAAEAALTWLRDRAGA